MHDLTWQLAGIGGLKAVHSNGHMQKLAARGGCSHVDAHGPGTIVSKVLAIGGKDMIAHHTFINLYDTPKR